MWLWASPSSGPPFLRLQEECVTIDALRRALANSTLNEGPRVMDSTSNLFLEQIFPLEADFSDTVHPLVSSLLMASD